MEYIKWDLKGISQSLPKGLAMDFLNLRIFKNYLRTHLKIYFKLSNI
jgi:hypothetical protein